MSMRKKGKEKGKVFCATWKKKAFCGVKPED